MITVLAIVAVLAGSGVAAWKFLAHHAHTAAEPTVSASRIDGSRSSAANSPSQVSPTPTSQLTEGSANVAIAPSAGQQPSSPQVAAFLQTYFTAINTHNFGLYSPLFEPGLGPTLQQFNQGYGSTSDSDVTLASVSPAATGLAAAVSFTSHQEPATSPTDSSCTAWDITLYLQPQGSTYLIVPPPAGYHAQYRSCP